MKNTWIGIIFALSINAFADTPPPGIVKLKGGTDGTTIGNVGDAIKVNATIGSIALPTNAAQESGGHLASMDTKLSTINSTLGSPFQSGGSISNTAFGINGSLPGYASPPTFNLGTLGGAATAANQAAIITALGTPFQTGGSIGNTSFAISGTLPAYASTPTFNLGTLNGAATNATLVTINSTLGSPFQSGGSIGNTSFGISGTLPAYGSTPTFNLGTISTAATAANQATANTSLASIDSKLANPMPVTGTFFQATQPVSGTVTATQTALATGQINNNASVTTVASTFTAPANAIGFILEAESGNTDNIRWAVGSTATASVGTLAEPGRDTGYLPLAANISVIAISGTQTASVQWVVR